MQVDTKLLLKEDEIDDHFLTEEVIKQNEHLKVNLTHKNFIQKDALASNVKVYPRLG